MQNNNSVWHFFASVKLALTTLFLIATTSIIGTIIPQKESFEWYISRYGPKDCSALCSIGYSRHV